MTAIAYNPQLPDALGTPIIPEAPRLPLDEGAAVLEASKSESAPEKRRIPVYSSQDPSFGRTVTAVSERILTDVYMTKGYIGEDDLDDDGIYRNKNYGLNSETFLAIDGSKVGTVTQIHTDDRGFDSFPTMHTFALDIKAVCEVAGVSSIADLRPDQVVEISALASQKKSKLPWAVRSYLEISDMKPVGVGGETSEAGSSLNAVLSLYAQMLRSSLEQGHKLWVQNVDRKFIPLLEMLTGSGEVRVLGPEKEYMGPPTTPIGINPQSVVRNILSSDQEEYKEYLRKVFKGIDDQKVPKDIRDLMGQNGIEVTEYPDWKRVAKKPSTIAGAIAVAYTVARDALAVNVEGFEGDPATLWAIDLGTAVPYGWGLAEMLTGKTRVRRALGALVAIPSFLAPYAYFYSKGENYPGYVNVVAGLMAGAVIVREIVAQVARARRERKITAMLESPQD